MPENQFLIRYQKLNDKQKQAVDYIEGPLLVVAGPGSGKTELLALRIANILKETQTSPDSILCLTFTDSGAVNMKERLEKIIGITAHKVAIHTFHSFARRIMDEYRECFYNAFELDVASDIDKEEILDMAFRELLHSSPMASYHPKLGWAYYRDAKNRIRDIKMAGYNSSEYDALVNKSVAELEIVNKIFNHYWTKERMNIKNIVWLDNLIKALEIKDNLMIVDNLTALAYKKELAHVYEQALEIWKTEPISAWSMSNIVKGNIKDKSKSENNIFLKEYENIAKTKDMAQIYTFYERELLNRGLYDYDDMIINVKTALYENTDLHNNIAERYTYIMIDEFQDTSNAQMDMVLAITNHVANEGRPNICVVGDDDQAIYKFQGAEINNIINYRKDYWKDVKVITLDINYRSTQEIIDLSQKVAEQAKYRLNKIYKDINKNLKSSKSLNTNNDNKYGSNNESISNIENRYYENKEMQYLSIAEEIKALLENNKIETKNNNDSNDITVSIIARDHKSLKEMSKYLNQSNVDFEYIYKQNALTMDPVRDILNVMQYIASLVDSKSTRDDLLIKIVSAPYWKINRKSIFDLAYAVKSEHITWWQAINKIEETQKIAEAILNIIKDGTDIPILQMLHKIETTLGIRDYYFNKNNKDLQNNIEKGRHKSNDVELNNNNQYYIYLEALRALYTAIEERDVNSNWTILNIIDFINIYDKYKLTLNINSINNKALVTLQTAHKSKGLEYDYVYIIDAEDKIWNGNKKKNITSIPKFLYQILTGPSEDEDDSVRLLYVSMTRAKHHLYISHVNTINRHIPQINSEQSNETVSTEENILNKNILALENSLSPAIYNIAEENILRSLLENYQMSITHLNNYLKIEEGGPVHFFKENLLRFPQPMNSSGAYGSAIHDAIESIFTTQITNNISNKENIKHEANVMALEGVINKFRISLSKKRLDKIEENKLYNRGVEVLTNFYEKKYPIPHTLPEGKGMGDGMIEYNLAHENIQIGEAHITGKLDYVYIVDNKVNVLDWKTGKTLHSWDKGLSAVEKVKAHRYKYQLMMYRLLIESSNKFKSYSMGEFGLQFVEDENIFTLYYEHDTVGYERFKKLLIAVWQAINNLEFSESIDYIPTSDYETLKLEDLIKWEDEMISNHKI